MPSHSRQTYTETGMTIKVKVQSDPSAIKRSDSKASLTSKASKKGSDSISSPSNKLLRTPDSIKSPSNRLNRPIYPGPIGQKIGASQDLQSSASSSKSQAVLSTNRILRKENGT